jgi:hypothetical protein
MKFIIVFQMVAPRSVDELAASVEWWDDEGTTTAPDWTAVEGRVGSAPDWTAVEGRVGSAPWPRAFLNTPMMRAAGRDRYFLYMVCCSGRICE